MLILNDFLSSGHHFKREENLYAFQFALLNTVLGISIFFALFALFLSFSKLFVLTDIFNQLFILYILTNLFQLYLLRKNKKDYTLIAMSTMLISILLFYFPLLYEYDEFRLIWFFILLFVQFVLLGKNAGIILMLLLQGSIFLLNYHYPLGFSTLALFSFFHALILFSILLYFFIDKIEKDAKELLRLNIKLAIQAKVAIQEKQEKVLLLEEVHHRVKNNLAIILSIIQLQQYDNKEPALHPLLNDLQNRINSIAKTYEMLILNKSLESIDMSSYIHALLIDIQESLSHLAEVKLQTHIQSILPLKEAVYIGLVINELVTNAYKYAFNNHEGEIYIEFVQDAQEYTLIIQDNGCGFDVNTIKKSLGSKLVHSLITQQLKGSLSVESKYFTKYTIKFSLL